MSTVRPSRLVCAVDVGTRSARAGVVQADGCELAREICAFPLLEGPAQHRTYRFSDIRIAVRQAVSAAVDSAGVEPAAISGLALSATCSLVLRDAAGEPLSTDPGEGDVVAWCDHRAADEARDCSQSPHALVDRNGGFISPEMQTPKLLWIKRHRPVHWQRLGQALDLSDALAMDVTGVPVRSLCSMVAKWPYDGRSGWLVDYLRTIGLEDLPERVGFSIPIRLPGTVAGPLSGSAADAMSLSAGIPVAVGLVDAFAGALGATGMTSPNAAGNCLNLITGTSNVIMSVGSTRAGASGFWGPYRDVIMPGAWVSEAGQSAAGALLDHLLELWSPGGERGGPSHAEVLDRIDQLYASEGPHLAGDIHLLPDFAGNRAPFGDPSARGLITGLPLERGMDALCRVYWRGAVSLALGIRQLLEHGGMPWDGDELAMLGGFSRTRLLIQLFADVTGRRMVCGEAGDRVIDGTAALALKAAGDNRDLASIAAALIDRTAAFEPDPDASRLFDRDYKIFNTLQKQRDAIDQVG
ncbi:FGGY-family carbohydrate kinase [Spiribacter onubensis]|uniref:FGGY-family carbohydrate kinase n=1 Tax=Spiribacter onubensis TaxID=3122420 RepID=UPI00349F520D